MIIDLDAPNGLTNTLKIKVCLLYFSGSMCLSGDLRLLLQCHTVKQKAAAVALVFPSAPMC